MNKITGQSTTIHSFEALFSSKHESHGKEFLEDMVNYMPISCQKSLGDLFAEISKGLYNTY